MRVDSVGFVCAFSRSSTPPESSERRYDMSVIRWTGDLDDGLRRAAEEGKLVLLDFFSPT
jgi:hypothetical protein